MVEVIEFAKPELKNDVEFRLPRKLLCILEGQLELKYIHKLFKICGYTKGCDNLGNDCIKLNWGKEQKIEKCNFSGGSNIKGYPTPQPALESLNKEKDNFWLYEYVIVIFDSDKDINNKVENFILEKKNDKIILLVSNPCFEATLIDYCYCGKAKININKIPDTEPPCYKYKKNFSSLGCFNGVNHLIQNLELFTSKNIKLNSIQYYINLFFDKYCNTTKPNTE